MAKRIVYGQNPVRELVAARAGQVQVVYLAAGDRGPAMKALRDLCAQRRVTVEERDNEELDALAGADARHQGVVAITGELPVAELEQILEDLEESPRPPLLVVVDSVQDPQNFGAIVRSAHVLGAHAVITAKDRAAPITAATVKASAGATEHVPIARVTNLVRALEQIKEAGIWTVGAVSEDGIDPTKVDMTTGIALVVGAEGKGLRPLVAQHCDHRVKIPMFGKVASLNVSVATGILLYEVSRQRSMKK